MLPGVTLALLSTFASATELSPNGVRSLPTLSAEHVRLHRPSNTELSRSRVELSPDGLRSVRLREKPALEILQDFAAESVWFADRDRGVVHETSLAPPSHANDETVGAELTGFLGTEPCGGGNSREEGRGRWRNRPVHAFACENAHGQVGAIELVDAVHGIVVYRRTPDGLVDELRDIRPRRFPPGHFSPSPRFRRVGAQELIHGTPTLSMFREPDTETLSNEFEISPAVR